MIIFKSQTEVVVRATLKWIKTEIEDGIRLFASCLP